LLLLLLLICSTLLFSASTPEDRETWIALLHRAAMDAVVALDTTLSGWLVKVLVKI
jgi:hypothetical protein